VGFGEINKVRFVMSRIGKKEISIPDGVEVKVDGQDVHVKGPKGELGCSVHPCIQVGVEDKTVVCSVGQENKKSSALWGTNRARIASMIEGVSKGFMKELELKGVGYKANVKGRDLELFVGYSHPVVVEAPEGISLTVEKEVIRVEGADAVQVGQVAADIRKIRKPEPYKGKGIRYRGEHVRRKVGKVVGVVE
jgi:large subunit ribosomal protein L6